MRKADVAIDRGLIVSVGEGLQATFPPERLLDAQGQYVMAGLADMHTHFGTGIRPSGEDDTAPVLARLLHYGVTTALNLGSGRAWPERIDAMRGDLRSGALQGPRLLAAGALITVPGSHPTTTIYPPALQARIAAIVDAAAPDGPIDLAPSIGVATTLVRTADDMRAEVRRLGDWGADVIKIVVESGPPPFGGHHPRMSRALIAAAVEAADAYHLPVLCHVSSVDELEACLECGAGAVAHAVGASEPLPQGLEQRMAAAGLALIPTASLFEGWLRYDADPSLLDDPWLAETMTAAERAALRSDELRSMLDPARRVAQEVLPSIRAHVKAARDAGVLIVAGTDIGNPYRFPGYSLHEELALYVSVGLTPGEALATATVNAAALVGGEDEWGSVREGLAADLLVLGANPLDDIRHTRTIRHVIRAGRVVDRASLPVH